MAHFPEMMPDEGGEVHFGIRADHRPSAVGGQGRQPFGVQHQPQSVNAPRSSKFCEKILELNSEVESRSLRAKPQKTAILTVGTTIEGDQGDG